MKNKEYTRGYNDATGSILKGGDPQILLNEARNDIDEGSYNRGWKDACKDKGAK